MRLKLKEDPREWRKFTIVWSIALTIVIVGLHRRGVLSQKSSIAAAVFLAVFFAVGMALPRGMRIPYRGVMTISFYVGQVMGRILLTIFYLFVLTPLGLLLRAIGKDFLNLKKSNAETFWEKATEASSHERMF